MCTIEIRTGQGGEDAERFAARLAKSVLAWADRNGYPGGTATPRTRAVTLTIPRCPAGEIRWLSGIHRIQHTPRRGSRGNLRQTSKVTLVALDETAPAATLSLRRDDPRIRVETKRGSGRGGQRRNKVETSVTVTWLPDPAVTATRNNGRSQAENLAAALAELAGQLASRDAAAAAEGRNQERGGQASEAVVFSHNAFEGHVRHEPTGETWTLRTWDQGRFARPAAAA